MAWLGAGMIWLSVFLINTMSSWRRQERRLNELAEQQHGSEQRVRFAYRTAQRGLSRLQVPHASLEIS
jgi:hypothetical protein